MKYKRRPTEVDAEQWFPGKKVSGVVENAYKSGTIRTDAGPVPVMDGDWVVTTERGEKLVYKPDVFEKTYEKA